MAFCSKCGVEILAKEAYCTACGAQIDITTTNRISEHVPNMPKVTTSEISKNDDSTGIIGTVVIVFLIGFGYMKYEGFNAIGVSCIAQSYDRMSCQFTNDNFVPDTRCIKLKVVNENTNAFVQSDKVCSGIVWPNETIERNIYIDMQDVCRKDCSVDIIPD